MTACWHHSRRVWMDSMLSPPQGANSSPILANITRHYVLDLWFYKRWRTQTATGEAIIARCEDTFVVEFQKYTSYSGLAFLIFGF